MGRDVLRPDQAQRPRGAAQGRGGPEPLGATRSASRREHGEDGEDRTLPGASTVAAKEPPSRTAYSASERPFGCR